jgi:hypothetical protein
MKKFIYSIFVFSVLIAALYFLISFLSEPKSGITNDCMAAIIDKHNHAQSIAAPKIIFSGGSNLAFGINSEKIENEMSIPVVNFGLHGGLGLQFMLNELKNVAKEGDIVFLSIEYYLSSEGEYALKKSTSNLFAEAKNYYAFDLKNEINSDIDRTRRNIKSYLKGEISAINIQAENQVYSRKSFNKYGDIVAHLDLPPAISLNGRSLFSYQYWYGIQDINEFAAFAKSKHISVFFLYTNFPKTEYDKNKIVIDKYATDLSTNLQVEILNKPEDFVFPDSLFYDTIYHLNRKGREDRTQRLIEILKSNPTVMKCVESMTDSMK